MENLVEIVKNSKSYNEVLKNLNRSICGSNYEKIKKIIIENKIDISHFTLKRDPITYSIEKSDDELFCENSKIDRGRIKHRIIKNKLIDYKCEFCGNNGEWMGKKFSLILDHINGINNDNRLSNLRFLCPNCNATLDTHCGKNKKKEVKVIDLFEIRKSRRTVDRPPFNVLLDEIKEMGWVSVGKKYGVSDNAIRKWVKTYEKYGK